MGATTDVHELTEIRRLRAERYLSSNLRKHLRNPQVRPHWIGQTDTFWFRQETPDGTVFTVVDAAKGEQRPAFDHARILAATGRAHITDLDLTGPEPRVKLEDGTWLRFSERGCDQQPGPAHRPGEAMLPGGQAVFARNGNLWVRNGTGERTLTTDGEAGNAYGKSADMNLTTITLRRRGIALPPNLLPSPDGTRFFTSRLDERGMAEYPLVQHVPDDGTPRAILHTFKYAMTGDEVVPIERHAVVGLDGTVVHTVGGPYVSGVTTCLEKHEAWWSADGTRVFFLDRDRLWRRLTLNEMDAASGAVRAVYTEVGHTHLDTNASVQGLPNVRVLDRSGSFVWFSQRDGWGHLYLHDLATGALRNRITAGEWLVRDLLNVDEEAGTVEFLAAGIDPTANPYHRMLCRARLDGTGMTMLTPSTDDHALAMPLHRAPRDHIRPPQDLGEWRAPSGRFFVHTHSDLTTLPISELRRANGTLVAELARAELDLAWRAPEPFRVLADDGQTELWGAVWLPTDFDPARRYPVIDYIYPGPQRGMTPAIMFTDTMPELFRSCMPQAWAELGFAVVNVDGRGTPLRSKAFQDTSYGKLDDPGTLPDHVATLRQLAERHAWFDTSRVGIMGHSGGGYASVRAMLEYPEVFHAAVATSGNHDQRGYSYAWTEKYMGAAPRQNGDGTAWAQAANPALAARLRGKLLLAHGDMDDNVHPALTMQLAAALIAADKDFDFIPLPNDDHTTVWSNPYFLRRAMQFMVRHLHAKD